MARPPGAIKNTQYAGATEERVKRGVSWLTKIQTSAWLDAIDIKAFDNRSAYSDALGLIFKKIQQDITVSPKFRHQPGFVLARRAYDFGELNPMALYALSDWEAIERGFECVWDSPNRQKEELALNRQWTKALLKLKGAVQ